MTTGETTNIHALGVELTWLARPAGQDWDAHAAARRVAQERGEPRPPAPGPGLGGLGVALALLGLVPLVLGGVRAHLMEVRHCYDQTLARDPRPTAA